VISFFFSKSTDDLVSTAGTRLVGLIKTGTESLLASLCSKIREKAEEKTVYMKYLEKCLIHGASMSKTSPYFCEWFCETLGDLLQREELAGESDLMIDHEFVTLCLI